LGLPKREAKFNKKCSPHSFFISLQQQN